VNRTVPRPSIESQNNKILVESSRVVVKNFPASHCKNLDIKRLLNIR